MDRIEPLIKKLLIEFNSMSPEQIKEFNAEWLAGLEISRPEGDELMEKFINTICETAIERATKKLQLA